MNSPLVSVIIPLYNGSTCIQRALDSILQQSFHDYEIIVVDDSSTDDSAQIIAAYVKCYPTIIQYYLISNRGPGKAIEYGVKKAHGTFVAFLDQDDYWFKTKLERQLEQFNKDNDLALVATDYCEGQTVNENHHSVLSRSKHFGKSHFEQLLLENPICSPSVMVKRDVLFEIGFSDSSLSYGPWDRPLWLKIAYKYKIEIIKEVLVWKYYNLSTLSMSRGYPGLQAHYWKYLLDYFSNLPSIYLAIMQNNCAICHYKMALNCFWDNHFSLFRKHMRKAFYYIPQILIFDCYFYLVFFPSASLKLLKRLKQRLFHHNTTIPAI